MAHKDHEAIARDLGYRHVQVINPAWGAQQAVDDDGRLRIGWDFSRYLIALPAKAEWLRDDLAVRLGDDKCTWAEWPFGADKTEIGNALITARPMWTDEIAGIDDIPDPGPEVTYTSDIPQLDEHGFRFVLPAFMPIIGPYGSGKSVLLRQLLVNLWRLHGWKFLLTSFEETVKPRYQRDFRRHLIGKPYVDRGRRHPLVGRGDREGRRRDSGRPRNSSGASGRQSSTLSDCSTASSSPSASTASRWWRSTR